ncbi:MAG TPA: hypothetical protein VIK14_02990 [Ignavibacteria bacterium]
MKKILVISAYLLLQTFLLCGPATSQVNTENLIVGNHYTIYISSNYKLEGIITEKDSVSCVIKTDDNKTYKVKFNQITQIENNEKVSKDLKDTATYYTVTTKDENEIDGRIVNSDSTHLYLITPSGVEIKIPRDKIVSIEKAKSEVFEGKIVTNDPNLSRLFVAPTARPIGNGRGYFSAAEIFFPMLGLGITDYVSLSLGMTLFPGGVGQLFYGNIKVTPVQTKEFYAAAGFLYTGITSGSGWNAGILYGVSTAGNNNNSISFGAGLAFQREKKNYYTFDPYFNYSSYEKTEVSTSGILMLGGELRAGKNVKLITENWVFLEKDAPTLLSVGLRFFGTKVAGDFGLVFFPTIDIEVLPFIPYLSFTYNY